MNTMMSKVRFDNAKDKAKRVTRSVLPAVFAIGAGFICADVMAQAPAAGGEALTQVGDNVKAVVKLGLQLILAITFLIVAWAILAKFNDARRGRADWGEVVVPFVVGAAVVILIIYLHGEGLSNAELIGGG